jgi:hypothetical protein
MVDICIKAIHALWLEVGPYHESSFEEEMENRVIFFLLFFFDQSHLFLATIGLSRGGQPKARRAYLSGPQ